MNQLKKFIKKYFSSFAFFYTYLRSKIFYAFGLSIAVSILDGLGLSMFFPLLQVVGGENINVESSDMGNLSYLVNAIEALGLSLNLISVLSIMVIFFVFKGIASYISNVYNIFLHQSFMRKIRLDLLKNLNQISYKKFILSDAGRIQNTMTGEVGNVSTAFATYFNTFQQVLMLLVYISFAFFLDSKFALLVSLGGLSTHILYSILYKHTVIASRKLTKYGNEFQGLIIQHVAQFKYLKATARVNNYSKHLEKSIAEIEDSRRRMGILSSIGVSAREPLLVIIISIVILVQVKFLGGNIGTMLISLLFFYRALTSLTSLQQNWNKFLQVTGSMENMKDFQKMLQTNREKNGNLEMHSFNNKIVFENVSFYYDYSPILNSINLEIPKNKSIALVGESGSGKTTLVNLISALIHEDKGKIYIDDTALKSIKKETYQNRIGYVSQDAVIFNDSIFNNVTFWAEKNKENLSRFYHAISQASLSNFLNDLAQKENTILGNNGINLSGGQKQRISIARELYKKIDILILDEATSALDSETEKEIQNSIDSLQGQYTLIIVAHRLSTIRNVDQVVLMDRGRILAIDTFDNLAKNHEKFQKMIHLQEL